MADRIQLRRDTAANWTNYNPILLEGEPGIELDTDQWKLGDGVHNWADLPYRGGECVQQKGQSTTVPMSQKAVTDELIKLETITESIPKYFINTVNNLNSRIKEIYFEGIDKTKNYELCYCRWYAENNYFQIIIRDYTQPNKSDAVYAFMSLSNQITSDGVIGLIAQNNREGKCFVVLTMTKDDTSRAYGDIDLNVACNINYSPEIKAYLDKVNTDDIEDYAVTEEKTTFFGISSANLYNYKTTEYGYLNGAGEVAPNVNFKTSDYIPVKASTLYYYVPSDISIPSDGRCVVFYDSLKRMVGTIGIEVVSSYSPVNAAYLRVTYVINKYGSGQVTEGEQLEYVPYNKGLLKKDLLPKVSKGDIEDYAVTEENTTFFDISLNLFNPNDPDVEQGYLSGDGLVHYIATIKTSGWIPVEPNTLYYFESSDIPLSSHARCIDFYDELKNFIDGSLKVEVESTTSPITAHWMRVSYVSSNNLDWDNGQITKLQKYPYSEYGAKIKKEYLPNQEDEEIVPEVVFPSRVYALKGFENSIYFKNIIEYKDPKYIFDGYGGIWNYHERYVRTRATNPGNISFKLKKLVDLSVNKSILFSTSIGDPATDNGLKNVNVVGDSFTQGGYWFDWINTCCPNLAFVGMRRSNGIASNLRSEGRGGWRLNSFFQPHDDITPTHMQPFSPFMHVSGYTYYGPIEFWKAIVTNTSLYPYGTQGFDDYISWFDNTGHKVNPATNDLMYDGTNDKYVYWNGSAWTDFNGTPNFTFDYTKYINTWNIASPDFVLIMLGVNDWFDTFSDSLADTWNSQMNTFIQSIQSYATSVNKTIVIGICTNTTIIGTPNNGYFRNVEINSRSEFLGRKNTIDTFDNDTYRNQGVYVVDTGACLDPDYGFVTTENKPFDYYDGEERELYDENGVHPSVGGYKQLGTCAAGFIQYIRGLS